MSGSCWFEHSSMAVESGFGLFGSSSHVRELSERTRPIIINGHRVMVCEVCRVIIREVCDGG